MLPASCKPVSLSRVSRRPSIPVTREPHPPRVFINPCEGQAQCVTGSPIISTEIFSCFLWIGASRSNPVPPPRSALILCACRLRRTVKAIRRSRRVCVGACAPKSIWVQTVFAWSASSSMAGEFRAALVGLSVLLLRCAHGKYTHHSTALLPTHPRFIYSA